MSVSCAREFSRDGKFFAFINGQGKFVVYEVATSSVSQIYTPNLHLNVPCTCFAWVEIGTTGGGGQNQGGQSAKKKKKRASNGGTSQTYVAFGTSKGGVALYCLASAKIELTLKGAGHSGPITAICADVQGDLLYTAGADGKVIEWSLTDSEQRKVHKLGVEKLTCLTVAGEGTSVLAGAKQLKLWDSTKGKLVKTLVGHTSNTMLVEKIVGQDGRAYALTGSVNDRNVSLWLLDGDDKSPVGLFAMDDAPDYFSSRMVGSKLHLAAVSKVGVAHYYIKDLAKININKPVKANNTYEVALDAARIAGSKAIDRLPIFTASIEFSPNQEQLLIAYGSELSLKFEQIPIEKDIKQNVIIREQTPAFHRKGQDEKDLKSKMPTVDKATAEFLNPVNAGKKSMKTVEIPMEARLENLALTADGELKSGMSQSNVAHLLIQGLHSKDAAILRSVFSKNEPGLIQRTAERIPAQYVSILLNEISNLMQMKTVHVATAICWLKALIHTHTSQLMALGSENLLSTFGSCLGIIEYRVEHANSLSRLNGRLELLVSQINRTERLAKNPEEMINTHVLMHQEEDDSDVDSVLGKEHVSAESSDEDGEGAADANESDAVEDDPLAGSFVRLRNGPPKSSEDEESDEESMQQLQVQQSSDEEEEEDDNEEMDVSD